MIELKTLIIIPGGGDPENEIYKKSFQLIKEEALLQGFSNVEVLSFPGHKSYSEKETFLNQKESSIILTKYFNDLESKNIKYSVFARSYGCGVLMASLLENDFPGLVDVKLWGPVPVLCLYDAILGQPENIEKAKSKGCFLNSESFNSCEPFEIQVYRYSRPLIIKIGVGTLDKYSKLSFYNFLIDYTNNKKNINYTIINGLEHEVLSKNLEYFNFIFK